jgi:hypothetical protein
MSHSPQVEIKPKADLLTIDPGFRYFAYSIFSEKEIAYADISKTKSEDWEAWTGQPPSFVEISEIVSRFEWVNKLAIVEFPQIHRDTPNPNDIVKLASACGAYTSLLQSFGFSVVWVKPADWKGTVPKEIMTKRIFAKIRESEYPRIKSIKDHNVIDAIGIGLWHLNRKTTL